MVAQLPKDLRELLDEVLHPATANAEPPRPDELPGEDFVQRPADRLGTDAPPPSTP
jgi:hypothetical protein